MFSDRKKLIIIGATAAAVIAGSFTVRAVAETRTFQHFKAAATETVVPAAFERVGWGGHRRHARFADMSAEDIENRISRVVRHAAIEIDATDEQTKKITEIATGVAKEIQPLAKTWRDSGKQIHDLMLKETIDRVELESLRAKRLTEADAISKRVTVALADIAEVLTPEQRKKLDERIEEMRGRFGGRRGWRH